MGITTNYIMSQLFTIITYILLCLTYYSKSRRSILVISLFSTITSGIAYIFLNAYTGLAMCFVSVIRNMMLIQDEKENPKDKTITKKDKLVLIVLILLSVLLATVTYDGYLSLLSVFATILYTYSVWQKETSIYKLMGIPVGVLWMLYHIYIKSFFGILLEGILLICSIKGYYMEQKRIRNK